MTSLGKTSKHTSSYKHTLKLIVVKHPHNGNISWCTISSLYYYYYYYYCVISSPHSPLYQAIYIIYSISSNLISGLSIGSMYILHHTLVTILSLVFKDIILYIHTVDP